HRQLCLLPPAPHASYLATFFFSSRRRHTRFSRDWSSDVCSSDLHNAGQCWPAGSVTKYPGVIRVRIGPPIACEGLSRDELHEKAEQWIRSAMAELKQEKG